MPKATVELIDGTKVTVDGSLEDVKNLLAFYGVSVSEVSQFSQMR